MQLLDMLTKYWPTLLAMGVVTTAINQAVQKISSVLAPRWPWVARISNVVNTISVDYAKLLAELGGAIGIGPRAKKDDKSGQAPLVGIIWIVALLGVCGCSSFLHWSPSALPDVAALCAFSGDVEPQLEALAVEYGIPIEFVRDAFSAACAETAKTAPDEAKHAGLSAARASAYAASKVGARFDGGAP